MNVKLEKFTHKIHSQQSLQSIYKVICYSGQCIERKLNVEVYLLNDFIEAYVRFDCKGEKIKEIELYEVVL